MRGEVAVYAAAAARRCVQRRMGVLRRVPSGQLPGRQLAAGASGQRSRQLFVLLLLLQPLLIRYLRPNERTHTSHME